MRCYRLIGIGTSTQGLSHTITTSGTIGRHPDNLVPIPKHPESESEWPHLGRYHASLERTATGWQLRHCGSINGTALLKAGDQARRISATGDSPLPLEPGDVIELAGTPLFNLRFEEFEVDPPPAPTRLVDDWDVARIQLIHHGLLVTSVRLGASLTLGTGGNHRLPLPIPSHDLTAARIDLRSGTYYLTPLSGPIYHDRQPIASPIPLGHQSILRFSDPSFFLLLLIPESAAPRNLSDILMDQDRITLGRGPTVTHRFQHPSVSREHAEIRRDNGKLTIRDLGSVNGTLVQGQPITAETPLSPGQSIHLGSLHFVADAACWPLAPRRRLPAST